MTPDMALVKLKNPIDKFSEDIRPLCLPFQIHEKPLCPDKSYDTGIKEIYIKETFNQNHIKPIKYYYCLCIHNSRVSKRRGGVRGLCDSGGLGQQI